MSRRDDGAQAEHIQVELDTYLDRRTAYMFGVTASGVRLDHYHPATTRTTAIRSSILPRLAAEPRGLGTLYLPGRIRRSLRFALRARR
jgi:hypothetical protein